MSAPRAALLSVPFPLTLRNFLPTGLAGALATRLGFDVHLASPYDAPAFTDRDGHRFTNHPFPSRPGAGGLPELAGVTLIDRLFKSIHLTGFAIEYPEGSLQNLTLSARRDGSWLAARAITALAPRGSDRRDRIRRAYGRYRPVRPAIAGVFDEVRPAFVLLSSPGHFWLDHFLIDEAARRGIPTVCIVLSWDNLYSRGPLCRRPDWLLVWSEEMRRQALDVHQFPAGRTLVVGPMQFIHYEKPPAPAEIAAMRARIGLGPDERYLAYVCGARTSTYDVEDVRAMLAALRGGRFGGLRIVVRPHPQGDRRTYGALTADGVLLDNSLDITADDTRPDAFDFGAIRHMAAFLGSADAVVSSWGTTALLEACLLDRPAVQLRWMDAVPHADRREVQLVRDFQRYIHMRAFDATGARLYCDRPADLESVLARLVDEREAFAARRTEAVGRLTCLPLGGVVDRICAVLPKVVPAAVPEPVSC
jgi:hypothetical protein